MVNRRDVLKAGGAGAIGLVTAGGSLASPAVDTPATLKVGGYSYDRVRAIRDGVVGINGLDLQFEASNIYALNDEVLGGGGAFDIAEVGLIPYMTKYIDAGYRDYVLIPVFISRTFRHRNIYVHVDSGIKEPRDLRGRRVGTPGYGASSNTWVRGILKDEYGVAPHEMHWIETRKSSDIKGGLNKFSGGGSRYHLPADFPLVYGPPGVDESELILSRQCDALITAITPRAVAEGNPAIRTLFPDVRATEQAYYRDTGIFPIMHVIAIRKNLCDAMPDLPAQVFGMYSRSKQVAYEDLATTTVLRTSLPWATDELETTRALMGNDYWRYGIEANQKELELAMRYGFEQSLVSRHADFREMFHPSTHKLLG